MDIQIQNNNYQKYYDALKLVTREYRKTVSRKKFSDANQQTLQPIIKGKTSKT